MEGGGGLKELSQFIFESYAYKQYGIVKCLARNTVVAINVVLILNLVNFQ